MAEICFIYTIDDVNNLGARGKLADVANQLKDNLWQKMRMSKQKSFGVSTLPLSQITLNMIREKTWSPDGFSEDALVFCYDDSRPQDFPLIRETIEYALKKTSSNSTRYFLMAIHTSAQLIGADSNVAASDFAIENGIIYMETLTDNVAIETAAQTILTEMRNFSPSGSAIGPGSAPVFQLPSNGNANNNNNLSQAEKDVFSRYASMGQKKQKFRPLPGNAFINLLAYLVYRHEREKNGEPVSGKKGSDGWQRYSQRAEDCANLWKAMRGIVEEISSQRVHRQQAHDRLQYDFFINRKVPQTQWIFSNDFYKIAMEQVGNLVSDKLLEQFNDAEKNLKTWSNTYDGLSQLLTTVQSQSNDYSSLNYG